MWGRIMKRIVLDTCSLSNAYPDILWCIRNSRLREVFYITLVPNNVEELLIGVRQPSKKISQKNKEIIEFLNLNNIGCECGDWRIKLDLALERRSKIDYVENIINYNICLQHYNDENYEDRIVRILNSRNESRLEISHSFYFYRANTSLLAKQLKLMDDALHKRESNFNEQVVEVEEKLDKYRNAVKNFGNFSYSDKEAEIDKLRQQNPKLDTSEKNLIKQIFHDDSKCAYYLLLQAALVMFDDTSRKVLDENNYFAYIPLLYMNRILWGNIIEKGRKSEELKGNLYSDAEMLCHSYMDNVDYLITSDETLYREGKWVLSNVLYSKKPKIIYLDPQNKNEILEYLFFNEITLKNFLL